MRDEVRPHGQEDVARRKLARDAELTGRPSEALRVQEVARQEARDALRRDLRDLRVASEREPGEERELVGGILALDVAGRDPPRRTRAAARPSGRPRTSGPSPPSP